VHHLQKKIEEIGSLISKLKDQKRKLQKELGKRDQI
jgi:hypothetical protein